MSTPHTDLHPCACGDPDCHEMVRATYARGHHLKKTAKAARRLVPLPGPDVPDEDLDMGLLEPDVDLDREDIRLKDGTRLTNDLADEIAEEILERDRPPGHLSAPAGGRERGSQRRAGPVSIKVRKDITAKIKMPLYLGGKVWEARDPYCGSTFVMQTDEIAAALTDIVCDSADLVAFFTGPAGGFMKYLNLAMALAPVAQVAWAHHVAHSVGAEGQPAQPDMRAYAA